MTGDFTKAILEAKAKEKEYLPSLYNITRYFDHCGFIGDYSSRLMAFIALFLSNKCVAVESLSGSGKTHMVDKLITLSPPTYIYRIDMSSPTAPFYLASSINKAKIVYIPELQKVASNPIVVEILKNFGEGKDIDRDVRNQNKQTVEKYHLDCKPFIYTLATENALKPDEELGRRVFRINTDVSEEQNKRVLEYKAMKRVVPDKMETMEESEVILLKRHVERVMNVPPDIHYVNPFAIYISKKIPSKFTISRTSIDHLFDCIEGVTKWYLAKEKRYYNQNNRTAFVSIIDNWLVYKIYGETFIYDVLHIPPIGRQILSLLGQNRAYSVSEVQKLMRDIGVPLKTPMIADFLNRLSFAGYLSMDTTEKMPRYKATDTFTKFESNINWKECFEKGKEILSKEYPEDYDKAIKAEDGTTIDPFTGEKTDIFATVFKEPPDIKPIQDTKKLIEEFGISEPRRNTQ